MKNLLKNKSTISATKHKPYKCGRIEEDVLKDDHGRKTKMSQFLNTSVRSLERKTLQRNVTPCREN